MTATISRIRMPSLFGGKEVPAAMPSHRPRLQQRLEHASDVDMPLAPLAAAPRAEPSLDELADEIRDVQRNSERLAEAVKAAQEAKAMSDERLAGLQEQMRQRTAELLK